MNVAKSLFVLALFALLAGCGKPVPKEKSAYVGEWHAKAAYLLITADGSVQYKRLKGGTTASLEAPLKGFTGDNFEVGLGPLATTFIVSQPPHRDGDQWKMVVNDVEMVRTDH